MKDGVASYTSSQLFSILSVFTHIKDFLRAGLKMHYNLI